MMQYIYDYMNSAMNILNCRYSTVQIGMFGDGFCCKSLIDCSDYRVVGLAFSVDHDELRQSAVVGGARN